jgi:hypothetical protein
LLLTSGRNGISHQTKEVIALHYPNWYVNRATQPGPSVDAIELVHIPRAQVRESLLHARTEVIHPRCRGRIAGEEYRNSRMSLTAEIEIAPILSSMRRCTPAMRVAHHLDVRESSRESRCQLIRSDLWSTCHDLDPRQWPSKLRSRQAIGTHRAQCDQIDFRLSSQVRTSGRSPRGVPTARGAAFEIRHAESRTALRVG